MTYHRAHARNSDPATSVEAADRVHDITGAQQRVLEVLKAHGPLTDEQLVDLLPRMSPSGVRSRRSELVERRLVRDSGVTTTTKLNRRTIIWEICQ
jgi:hypothetical protein